MAIAMPTLIGGLSHQRPACRDRYSRRPGADHQDLSRFYPHIYRSSDNAALRRR
ncbi:hypothetical protein LNQ52_13335 [Klebsiella pneumoniae subsp. pneumoniae]|nr:hypothetical protein [Klebsiella pneumoniae subsp. pneumoniae]